MGTTSSDFPLSGDALDTTLGGNSDAAVAIISSLGRSLVYGTYMGGSGSGMRQDHRIRKQILRMWLHGRRIPRDGAHTIPPERLRLLRLRIQARRLL